MEEQSPGFERHFRNVLGHFASGVSIVTGIDAGAPVGVTVQSFCSLSLDPPLILLAPSLQSHTWPHLEHAGRFCVNLLAEGQAGLARQFARSGGDKYAGVRWTASRVTRSPVIEGVIAWIDCRLESVHPGGDHVIAVARVLDLEARMDIRPLVFFQSGFQRVISTDPAVGEARAVVLHVRDMDAACRYYADGLGLSLLFRDGDRWATFSAGNFNIALATGDGNVLPEAAVTIKVADVAAALERAVTGGAQLVDPPAEGEHEIRAAFRDPDGHLFYLYSPLLER